jgi:4-aminobutyrate aminotransferase
LIKLVTELPGPRGRELLELSRRYEPRSMSEQPPVVWAAAEGIWVTDVDGNVFLDFSSGVLVANAGHSHPEIVREIQQQAGRVINCYDFVNEYRPLLARKLVEITPPNLDRAFILTTGAEATEAAIKMARSFTGRKEIIAFQGAFHGRTYGAMSAGGKRSGAGARGFGPFVPQVYLAPFANCYRCVFDKTYPQCDTWCFDYLDWLVETETESDIAAVITETYQGGAGSIIPPPEWMAKLDRWCRERGIVLIIDEVQASFGRTGKLFGFQHYDLTPNLLCLGKGISSTLPVSAVVGEARIMDALTPGSMSSTHGGNPIGARAALANIEVIIKDKLPENAARLGQYLERRFGELQLVHRCVGDARGMGLVWGLEVVKHRGRKEPDAALAQRIVMEACRRGLLMIAPIGHYGNVLRIAPPLIIGESDLAQGVDLLDQAMAVAAAA